MYVIARVINSKGDSSLRACRLSVGYYVIVFVVVSSLYIVVSYVCD